MTFFEILAMVRDLTAAIQAKDWVRVVGLVTAFIQKMLAGRMPVGASNLRAEDHAELTAALKDLETAAAAA